MTTPLHVLADLLDACEPDDDAPVTWGALRRQVREAANAEPKEKPMDTPIHTKTTLGERFDEIAARMDAAYAARKPHRIGSPEYEAADVVVEAVYADLRLLNKEIGA